MDNKVVVDFKGYGPMRVDADAWGVLTEMYPPEQYPPELLMKALCAWLIQSDADDPDFMRRTAEQIREQKAADPDEYEQGMLADLAVSGDWDDTIEPCLIEFRAERAAGMWPVKFKELQAA